LAAATPGKPACVVSPRAAGGATFTPLERPQPAKRARATGARVSRRRTRRPTRSHAALARAQRCARNLGRPRATLTLTEGSNHSPSADIPDRSLLRTAVASALPSNKAFHYFGPCGFFAAARDPAQLKLCGRRSLSGTDGRAGGCRTHPKFELVFELLRT